MKNSQGFSLIEVLVTIVLTTVGILGMVALQSKSIQYTQDAVNRNTAIALTNELVEIMRANRDELFVKAPPVEPMYAQLKESTVFYTTNGRVDFAHGDCVTPAQTAKQQAGCWLAKVRTQLPGGDTDEIAGQIKLCPSFELKEGEPECAGGSYTGSTMAIQVAWRSKESICGKNLDSDICTFVTRVEL